MAKYDMQLVHLVKMRLTMKNLIMKNGLKKTRSLREEVERAMDNAELEVCYFDHDHVCKIPSLVPMAPPKEAKE